MNKMLVSLLLLVAAAATAAVADSDDEAALRQLLDQFMVGATAGDRATHERFWDEDLVYTSSAGLRFGKADILASLRAAAVDAAAAGPVYSARDVELRLFGDTALVTFRLVATEADGSAQHFFNSGVFRKADGQWRAVGWQATRAADD